MTTDERDVQIKKIISCNLILFQQKIWPFYEGDFAKFVDCFFLDIEDTLNRFDESNHV